MVVLAPSATDEYYNWLIGWTSPNVAQSTLIFFEGFRTLPGEVRMYGRILNRGRINIVELLFIIIKYMSLLASIVAPIQDWTNWLNPTGCMVLSWVQQMGMMLCTTLVTSTLAWRCYIIFQRNSKVGYACLTTLAVHLFLAIFTCCAQAKYDITNDGYCAHSAEVLKKNHGKKWWQMRGSWFVLISAIVDTVFVSAASWRLLKYVQGPTGLQRIGRLLFINNLHYLAIISSLNFGYFWILIFLSHQIPPLLWIIITVQVIVSLQMLISEQDEAHGHGSRPTYHTAWRGGGGGTAGGASSGAYRGSSFAPLKSASNTKSHTTSMTTTLTQQQTISPYTQPLEGIRFDELHETIIDTSTMSQLQPPSHQIRSQPPPVSRPPNQMAPSARVAPWEYQEADGSVAAYANDEVPGYSPGPHGSREPFKGHGYNASAENLTANSSPRPGMSIKAIRAGLNSKAGPEDEQHHDAPYEYAMSPLKTAASNDPLNIGQNETTSLKSRDTFMTGDMNVAAETHAANRRADSVHSEVSVCTCGRASISYGTALTRELSNYPSRPPQHHDGHSGGGGGGTPATQNNNHIQYAYAHSGHDQHIEEMENNDAYVDHYSPPRQYRG
ncbi:unnamed protein product [Parajaminaea phylloscopi]